MPAAILLKMFAKISCQLFADAGVTLKKSHHPVYSLNLEALLVFKQGIHFFSHVIDIEGLAQNVVHFNGLFGVQFDPALIIKVFQGGQYPSVIGAAAVKDGRDIHGGPDFFGMAMIHERLHKLLSFAFKAIDDFDRLSLILE